MILFGGARLSMIPFECPQLKYNYFWGGSQLKCNSFRGLIKFEKLLLRCTDVGRTFPGWNGRAARARTEVVCVVGQQLAPAPNYRLPLHALVVPLPLREERED